MATETAWKMTAPTTDDALQEEVWGAAAPKDPDADLPEPAAEHAGGAAAQAAPVASGHRPARQEAAEQHLKCSLLIKTTEKIDKTSESPSQKVNKPLVCARGVCSNVFWAIA